MIAEINLVTDFHLILHWHQGDELSRFQSRERRRKNSFKLSKFAQGEINIPVCVIEQFEYQGVKNSFLLSFNPGEGRWEGAKLAKTKGKMKRTEMKSLKMNERQSEKRYKNPIKITFSRAVKWKNIDKKNNAEEIFISETTFNC